MFRTFARFFLNIYIKKEGGKCITFQDYFVTLQPNYKQSHK